MSDSIIYIDSEQQLNDLISEGNLIVDFYADWCSPCRAMAPALDTFSQRKTSTVAKVNVDLLPELGGKFKIRGIPTILGYNKEGIETVRVVGAQSLSALEDISSKIQA